MPLYSLGDHSPQLGPGAWAAPSADLIGDVHLGPRASVWFGAVIRADNTPIVIAEDSNIQDGPYAIRTRASRCSSAHA